MMPVVNILFIVIMNIFNALKVTRTCECICSYHDVHVALNAVLTVSSYCEWQVGSSVSQSLRWQLHTRGQSAQRRPRSWYTQCHWSKQWYKAGVKGTVTFHFISFTASSSTDEWPQIHPVSPSFTPGWGADELLCDIHILQYIEEQWNSLKPRSVLLLSWISSHCSIAGC